MFVACICYWVQWDSLAFSLSGWTPTNLNTFSVDKGSHWKTNCRVEYDGETWTENSTDFTFIRFNGFSISSELIAHVRFRSGCVITYCPRRGSFLVMLMRALRTKSFVVDERTQVIRQCLIDFILGCDNYNVRALICDCCPKIILIDDFY